MNDRAQSAVSRLDSLASRFPNKLTSGLIDLNPYAEEIHQHQVKNVSEYSVEVGQQLFDPQESAGLPLPWSAFHGHFNLRPHELTVWVGYKGHGKSAVLSQILLRSMMAGEKVFVLSPEFRPAMVILRMIFQKLETRNVMPEQLVAWFKWAEAHLWLYDVQSSLKPQEVVALCRYVADKIKPDHILVDSLMKCGIPPDDYAAQKKLVDALQSIAHNNPLHLHLVAHARKGSSDDQIPRLHDIKGASEIGDMAENVVVVWRNKKKELIGEGGKTAAEEEVMKGPDAMCVVEAQRNADGWIGSVPLWFNKQSILFYGADQICPI